MYVCQGSEVSQFQVIPSWFCIKDFYIINGFVSTNKIVYTSKGILCSCNSQQNMSFRAWVSNDNM